jgi:hypothetical protein
MAEAEDDILRDAIIGTDKEIFAEGFGKEELTLDETGDRGLETMGDGLEGQHEPEDEENEPDEPDNGTDDDAHPKDEPENPDAVEAKAKAEAEAKDKPAEPDKTEPQGRIPPGRLREEAERARAAIAERDTLKAQLDAEKAANAKAVSDLNAKFDALLALQQRQPAPKPEDTAKPKAPDLFEDPNAFAEHLNKSVAEKFDAFQKQMRDREVNASIESARARHGEAFSNAWKAIETLPKSPETVQLIQRLEASPNPGEAIVLWHKRNQAIREVGDDLDGYKARLAEKTRTELMADPEFRKELLASLRSDAMTGDQGRPRTAVKLPNSLARTPGSNQRAPNDLEIFDGSESATFNSAWST